MQDTFKADQEYIVEWTEEEDEKLKTLASQTKQKNWNSIAEAIGTKTPSQCRHRWKTEIGPDVLKVKGRWTPEVCNFFFLLFILKWRKSIHHHVKDDPDIMNRIPDRTRDESR